jgi:hypothetical protein
LKLFIKSDCLFNNLGSCVGKSSGVRRKPAEGDPAGPFEGKFPEGEYGFEKNLGHDFGQKSTTGLPLQKFLRTPLGKSKRKKGKKHRKNDNSNAPPKAIDSGTYI